MKKKKNKILSLLLFLFKFLFEWGLFAVIIFAVALGNAKNLPFSNFRFYVVSSGSMEPTIKTGSLILINTKFLDLKPGDIITFETPRTKKIVTHRISTIKHTDLDGNEVTDPNKYLISTKGDANDTYDPWILVQKNVIGKVVFTIPYLGYISTYAKTPKGFILIVLLPALFIIFDEVLSIKKFYEEEFRKKVRKLETELAKKQK